MIRRTPLARSQKPLKRTPVKKRRTGPARRGPMRDKGYLAWLRTDTCCVACRLTRGGAERYSCQSPPDAAHGPVNGASQKGPDNGAIGLGAPHHREQHRIGWPAFEAKYRFSREGEARKLYAAYLAQKGKQ